MGVSRWRVMLSSTVDNFLVDVRQIIARTQLEAETRATNLLRVRRVTAPKGQTWDRWDLGVRPNRTGAWTAVAMGDHTGAITTTRTQPPRELTDGLG